MKPQSDTAQMIGQIVEPASKRLGVLGDTDQPARYRLDQLVSQDIAKRTFIATELYSHTQVVLKLILFCPNLKAEEEMLQQATELNAPVPANYLLASDLPYRVSFESKTPIGAGLVLVKPYVTSSSPPSSPIMPISNCSTARPAVSGERDFSATPTRHPQKATPLRQLVYSTFRVRPTPDKLEIQFLESSVKEGLAATHTDASLTNSLEIWAAVVIGTVVFVGGVMAMTGSLLIALAVATMLPLVFYALTGPAESRDRIAILRLTSASEGRTLLGLTTMKRPARDRFGRVNGLPQESKLHCTRLSINTVKVSPTLMLLPGKSPLMAQLSFTFHSHNSSGKRLSIVGSYAEIRWLSHHLAQWSNQRPANQ